MEGQQFRLLVSGVLKNHKGEMLILERSKINQSFQGCWQLPEGKVEFGEEIEKALTREIQEETGLSVRSTKLLFATTCVMDVQDKSYHVVRLVYEVKWEGHIILSTDHSTFRWISLKNIDQLQQKIDGLDEILERLKG